MKVATILPQNYLHYTEKDDYFMCLGHLIGKVGYEKYTKFFSDRAREGKFVIMDNGLIEGDQRPITQLAVNALNIGATELILTDVFCNKDATVEAVKNDMLILKWNKLDKCVSTFMIVPQGNSIDEWIECAKELWKVCHECHITNVTWGVPKVLVKIGGRDGRIDALKRLCEEAPAFRHQTFHLLGCWTTPLEITMVDKWSYQWEDGNVPHIRGVDSAIPFVYARAGIKIDSDDRPDSDPIDFKETKVNEGLLRYNIRKWRRAGVAHSFVSDAIERILNGLSKVSM